MSARGAFARAGLAVLVAVPLAACGLIEEGTKAISATTTTVAGAQPQPGGGGGNANAVTCMTELDVFQLAVDSYTILNGGPPANEAALVPDWLRAESQLFDLAPDGSVVPAPGSGC